MKTLPFRRPVDADRAGTETAAALDRDGIVLLPTETYYGLAADPRSSAAVRRVYKLKDRPLALALPILAAGWRQVEELVEIPDRHRGLLSRSWPGPLTAVLRTRTVLAACPDGSAAVRIPGHRLLRSLLALTGAVTGTSANRHGWDPPTTCSAALGSLTGPPDLVLDGGSTPGGAPSVIVDLRADDIRVLRGKFAVPGDGRVGPG